MSETESPPPFPLRLRWVCEDRDRGRPFWKAFDGPWHIGHVSDDTPIAPKGAPPYSWGVGMLSRGQFGGNLGGRTETARQSAEAVELAFFRYLPLAHSYELRLEQQIEYAEWLGAKLPIVTEWLKRRDIDRENPFPLSPYRPHLRAWAREDRARGGRGLLTPTMMAEAFGADWHARIRG